MQACSWPPELSDLRLACEECHKRKIRCEPPREGAQGSCQACRTNRRTCLFSLKNRTGRPPKSSKTAPRAISRQSNQTPATASRRRLATHDSIHVSPAQTITAVSHHGPRDPYNVENNSTAQGRAAAQDTTQPALNYNVDDLFFPDDSTSGPAHGDESLESPIPVTTYGQETVSYHDTPEPYMELWQHEQEPTSRDRWMTTPEVIGELSDRGSLPDSVSIDRVKQQPTPIQGRNRDTQDGSRGGPRDFLDTIRFFCETSNHCQGNLLDIQASSDKPKLSIILGNIEELGRKAAAAAAARDPEISCPLGGGRRQDQYIRMLTRVAVMGAVDIADDLLKYNLDVQHVAPSGVRELELQRGDTSNVDAASVGIMTGDALESVLSLVRLDFSLRQFALFLSTDQCDVDPCQRASSLTAMSSMEHSHREGKGEAGTPTLLRMAQMRRQLWTLVGELRESW